MRACGEKLAHRAVPAPHAVELDLELASGNGAVKRVEIGLGQGHPGKLPGGLSQVSESMRQFP